MDSFFGSNFSLTETSQFHQIRTIRRWTRCRFISGSTLNLPATAGYGSIYNTLILYSTIDFLAKQNSFLSTEDTSESKIMKETVKELLNQTQESGLLYIFHWCILSYKYKFHFIQWFHL